MKLHEFFTDESKWTQKQYARDKDGNYANPLSDYAVSWCVIGGSERCGISQKDLNERLRPHLEHHFYGSISQWNDNTNTTFQAVKDLLISLDI